MKIILISFALLLSYNALAQNLGKKDLPLNEVEIKGKKTRYKVGTLGKSNIKLAGGYFMQNSEEVAIFLKKDDIPANSFLNEVHIFITNEGKPTANFMVHVYAKDDSTNWPGKELTKKMAHAEHGNEWVNVDFRDKRIPVKDVLIISVEWLAGNGNDDTPWQRKPNSSSFWTTSSGKSHNGQVLGSTNDYGMMDLCFRTSKRNLKEWYYSMAPGKKVKRGPIRYPNQWNPMIYCTYTYKK